MTTAPPKSEGAKQNDSNQPRPASDPVVSQGGEDYEEGSDSAGGSAGTRHETVGGVYSEQPGDVGQQELDGLDQNNILDGDSKTRGVDNDAYKQEREVDAAVDAAT